MKQAFFIILVTSLYPCCISAQNVIFDGGGDGTSWEDPQNWNPNMVPVDSNGVIIPNGFMVSLSSAAENLQEVAINAGSQLTVNASGKLSFINFPASELFVPVKIGGVLTNHGEIQIPYDRSFRYRNPLLWSADESWSNRYCPCG